MTCLSATPDQWSAILALFGDRGACAGCWCMYWRRTAKQYEAGKGAGNRAAFEARVREGATPPGVIGFVNGEPVAWCAVGPRAEFVRLEGSRILAPVDAAPVWSITCLFLRKDHRRRGLSAAIIRAAADFAASNGARVVEAYPNDVGADQKADAFLWTGIASAFRAAGFVEVARRSATRPIMRWTPRN